MSLLMVGGGGTRWYVWNPPNQTFLGFCEMEAVGRIEMRTCSDRGRPCGKTPIEFCIRDHGEILSLL